MNLPLAIIGFGGHGRVVLSALRAAGRQVIAATDLHPEAANHQVSDIAILSDEQLLDRFPPAEIRLVSGIGSIWPCDEQGPRRSSVLRFMRQGYAFCGVRHPFAWISPETHLAANCQVHAGVVIQPGTVVGDFTIINTRASLDHDCCVGEYCHIGPGATLSGNVEVGAGSHLGTGCTVIQGIKIGRGCLVAAGATVVRDLGDGQCVRGTPARSFQPKR